MIYLREIEIQIACQLGEKLYKQRRRKRIIRRIMRFLKGGK